MTGVSPESPGNIFRSEAGGRSYANISRIALEAAPAEGAPHVEAWNRIPEAKRDSFTYKVLGEFAPQVAEAVGVRLVERANTVGVWQQTANPNTVFEVVGTPEGALRFARAGAYVFGQNEAWAQRSATKPKANAIGLDIEAPAGYDFNKPVDVKRFWKDSGLEAVPGLGASRVNLADGVKVRVLFDRDLANLSQAAVKDGRDATILAGPALKALAASPLEGVPYTLSAVDLQKAIHDWKADSSGKTHLQGLERKAGGELLRLLRSVQESYLREADGPAEARGAETGQLGVSAPAQEVAPPPSGGTLGALIQGRVP